MNRRLNEYLNKRGAKELEASILEEYSVTMKERIVPEIERDIKENEELAAELRFSTGEASRQRKGKLDERK